MHLIVMYVSYDALPVLRKATTRGTNGEGKADLETASAASLTASVEISRPLMDVGLVPRRTEQYHSS